MRVGLVGVSGVGKNRLAEEVQHRFATESNHGVPNIISEYADEVGEDIQAVVGPEAGYLVNLMIAMERERLDRRADLASSPSLTCGTIIDTLAYLAHNIEALFPLAQAGSQAMQIRASKETAALQVLMLGAQDIWRYDYAFYLPIPKSASLVVPGAAPKFSDELVNVDGHIQEIIKHANFPVNTLDGTFEENVERVYECISQSRSSLLESSSSS